ncbi:MAG: hypothetical protein IPJ34_26965 [Myxococcales bacterium]|nr:hypothetical protein [Myxococcales bacterium]
MAPLLAAGLLAGCEEKPVPTSAASNPAAASTPSAAPASTTGVASGAAPASASATAPSAQASASATTTKPIWVPPPNVKKPYGAPPADGWPFEA